MSEREGDHTRSRSEEPKNRWHDLADKLIAELKSKGSDCYKLSEELFFQIGERNRSLKNTYNVAQERTHLFHNYLTNNGYKIVKHSKEVWFCRSNFEIQTDRIQNRQRSIEAKKNASLSDIEDLIYVNFLVSQHFTIKDVFDFIMNDSTLHFSKAMRERSNKLFQDIGAVINTLVRENRVKCFEVRGDSKYRFDPDYVQTWREGDQSKLFVLKENEDNQ